MCQKTKSSQVQYEILYAEGTGRRNKGLVHVSVYFLPRVYPLVTDIVITSVVELSSLPF